MSPTGFEADQLEIQKQILFALTRICVELNKINNSLVRIGDYSERLGGI
jgi:hypothetical protein